MAEIDHYIKGFDDNYRLGVAAMDDTHQEFLELVQQAVMAGKQDFATKFDALFKHTQTHFAEEEATMEAIEHGSKGEHVADHQRILGDMERFNQRAAAGRATMARAWVSDSLLLWFHTHAQTMDSALAADIKAAEVVE